MREFRLEMDQFIRRCSAMSRVAPFYTYPGCNKPNGTGECIVAHACAAEANFAFTEMERLKAVALAAHTNDHGVKLAAFPGDLVAAARKQGTEVLGELAGRNAITAKVHTSYTEFRKRTAPWSRVSIEAVLRARGA